MNSITLMAEVQKERDNERTLLALQASKSTLQAKVQQLVAENTHLRKQAVAGEALCKRQSSDRDALNARLSTAHAQIKDASKVEKDLREQLQRAKQEVRKQQDQAEVLALQLKQQTAKTLKLAAQNSEMQGMVQFTNSDVQAQETEVNNTVAALQAELLECKVTAAEQAQLAEKKRASAQEMIEKLVMYDICAFFSSRSFTLDLLPKLLCILMQFCQLLGHSGLVALQCVS